MCTNYGQVMKAIRQEANLCQADLAKVCGVTQGYISKVETGKQEVELITWLKFCAASGVDPLLLIEREPNRKLIKGRKQWDKARSSK